jgi:hypothetical protein
MPAASGSRIQIDATDSSCSAVDPGQQFLPAAVGEDAATADNDEMVGDNLNLAEQMRGQQYRGACRSHLKRYARHPS